MRTSTPYSANQTHSIHPSKLRETKDKRMAYTQTFQLAQRARGKLQREASQHDHNLRLLVGHANLLDSLMIALADAEREQEQWFNEVVRGSIAADDEEAVEDADEKEDAEEEEESRDWPHPSSSQSQLFSSSFDGHGWLAADYYSDSESDEDSESEVDSDDDMEGIEYTIPRIRNVTMATSEVDSNSDREEEQEDEDEDEDEDADVDEHGMYALRRTPSSHGSPPQLVADLTDDEEEESAPPSPPQLSLPFTSINAVKEKGSITAAPFFNHDSQSTAHHHDPFIYAIHQPPSVISTF